MKKLLLFIFIVSIVSTTTSCRTGYGCKGNSRTMTGDGIKKHGVRF